MSIGITRTILSKGYFPKELPPAFNTISFANFATSPLGRNALKLYKPADQYTECCEFKVARTGDARVGTSKIPHPYHFAKLSNLCSSKFEQPVSGTRPASPLSRAVPPVYGTGYERAIRPATLQLVQPCKGTELLQGPRPHIYFSNFRTRQAIFIPPCTSRHAVGWAIDPKLASKETLERLQAVG